MRATQYRQREAAVGNLIEDRQLAHERSSDKRAQAILIGREFKYCEMPRRRSSDQSPSLRRYQRVSDRTICRDRQENTTSEIRRFWRLQPQQRPVCIDYASG